jgi:hypothetical protein
MSSFYTTQFQAGLGMIEESRSFLELWEPGDSVQVLEEKVLEEGILPDVTARRVRNLVAEMWAPRFLANEAQPARDLKAILDLLNRDSLSQLCMLFTARAQLIFHEFMSQLYWPRYESGRTIISRDEIKEFIIEAMDEGKMQKRWSESTVHRVTGYLAGTAIDFDFMSRVSTSSYELDPPIISPKVALYLAYDLHFSGLSDGNALAHENWQLWGMNSHDVLRQLQYLGREGHFIVQGSVELVRLSWAYKNREEMLNAITR